MSSFEEKVRALNGQVEAHIQARVTSTGPDPDDGADEPPEAFYELGDLLRSAAPEIARVIQVAEGLLRFPRYVASIPWTEWEDLRIALAHLDEKVSA